MMLDSIIHNSTNSCYWETITQNSINSDHTESVCNSSKKVFGFDRFCKDHGLDEVHSIDGLTISHIGDERRINIIEFKGGIDFSSCGPNCFEMKGFASIHCGLKKLLNDSLEGWLEIFMYDYSLYYYIICMDNHIFFGTEKNAKKIIHDRPKQRKNQKEYKNALSDFKKKFQPFKNGHPYKDVIIQPARVFIEENLENI
jgi:hypothetical protein